MWDTLVGGLAGSGEDLETALVLVAEAGLDEPDLINRTPLRIAAHHRRLPEGYQVEDVLTCDAGGRRQPVNRDGEVMEIRAIEVAEAVRLLAEGEFTLEAALVIAEDILRRQAASEIRPEPGLTPGPALTQRDCRPGSPGVAPLCGTGRWPAARLPPLTCRTDCLAFDRARVLRSITSLPRRDFASAPSSRRSSPAASAASAARRRVGAGTGAATGVAAASACEACENCFHTSIARRRCSHDLDALAQVFVARQRGMEIARGQHQQLAIAQRGHVGRDLLLAQQTEFAEELAAPSSIMVLSGRCGHGARRTVFLAMAALVSTRWSGSASLGEQLADGTQRIGRQAFEQGHALDQVGRAQLDVQRRVLVDVRPAALQLRHQVGVHLAADQNCSSMSR